MKKLLPAALGTLAAVALSGVAMAQAAAPAAPAPQVTYGPAIPGVCLFSRELTAANSAIGVSFSRRMEDLGKAVQAELGPEGQALQTEEQQLNAQGQAMGAEAAQRDQAFMQRVQAFQQRAQLFEAKRQQRAQELQATQQKQLERIYELMNPVYLSVATQRGCSMIVNANTAYGYNPAMDIGPAVVSGLNAKITTLSFDREHLDQRAGATQAAPTAAGAAPRPAAAAPAKKPAKK